MEWGEFEELIGLLLTAIGFDSVEVTPRRGDGGGKEAGTTRWPSTRPRGEKGAPSRTPNSTAKAWNTS